MQERTLEQQVSKMCLGENVSLQEQANLKWLWNQVVPIPPKGLGVSISKEFRIYFSKSLVLMPMPTSGLGNIFLFYIIS